MYVNINLHKCEECGNTKNISKNSTVGMNWKLIPNIKILCTFTNYAYIFICQIISFMFLTRSATVLLILTLTNLLYSILQNLYFILYFLFCILFYRARPFSIMSYSDFNSIMYSILFYLARFSVIFYLLFYSVKSILQNPKYLVNCQR